MEKDEIRRLAKSISDYELAELIVERAERDFLGYDTLRYLKRAIWLMFRHLDRSIGIAEGAGAEPSSDVERRDEGR